MQLSTSKWEVSEFGGYKNLLWDYPPINIKYKVDWDTPEGDKDIRDLGYYRATKLMKIFLLKVKEFKLFNEFVNGATKTQEIIFGKKYIKHTATEIAVKSCLDKIIASDSEIKNLFRHYQSCIIKTKFYYEESQDPSKGEKGDDGGSGEEDSDEDGEGEGGKPQPGDAEAKQAFANAIEDITKGKPSGMFIGNDYLGGSLAKNCVFIHPSDGVNCQYTSEELMYANKLVSTLDINFDPQSDKITSLKSGKLDPAKIAEIVPGNTSLHYRIEENQTTKPFSVCILGDESGSMSGYPISSQRKLMRILYKTFNQIIPPEKIFVYGHSDGNYNASRGYAPGIFVYNDKYNHTFEKRINTMRARGSNYDGPVIEAVYKKVREFTEDNIIFISISDGQPAGSGYGGSEAIKDMKRIIEKCKRDGFVTIGIGFNYCGVRDIYNYNTIITNFSDMPKQVSGIINKVVKTEFQD